MKQFKTIFGYELKNYFANKIFVGVTVFLAVGMILLLSFPRIMEMFTEKKTPEFSGEEESADSAPENADGETGDKPVMLVAGELSEEELALVLTTFSQVFPDYAVKAAGEGADDLEGQILSGQAECAFYLEGLDNYVYYVDNLSMYDNNTAVADEALLGAYRFNAMRNAGIPDKEADRILSAGIAHEIVKLGKDQMQNFFYTYIMIFALYMVILLYGQMVASNVASEKSSRAMELLVTSARPVSMMFGKVLASCSAGLIQLAVVFGSAFAAFNLNRAYWDQNGIISSIFDMPLGLLGYMAVFFILGFLIYAFLFGAIGSTVSKLEDINTSVMPVTMLFVIGFLVVVMSMAQGSVDNTAMKVCSFVPFTSPMAMFTRIAMSTVPPYQIAVSVALLVCTVIGVGVISAKIYRVGVLLYGTRPGIADIVRALRKA